MARVSRRQAELIQKSLDEAAKATRHAETSAKAALDSAVQMATANEIALNSLKISERPWIFINVQKKTKRYNIHDIESASIIFEISNYGKAPAIIEDCEIGSNVGTSPTKQRTGEYNDALAPGDNRKAQQFFPPGIEYSEYTLVTSSDTYDDFLIPDVNPGQHVFFTIWIKYRGIDPAAVHETACCWRWDFNTTCWAKIYGSQYNYST